MVDLLILAENIVIFIVLGNEFIYSKGEIPPSTMDESMAEVSYHAMDKLLLGSSKPGFWSSFMNSCLRRFSSKKAKRKMRTEYQSFYQLANSFEAVLDNERFVDHSLFIEYFWKAKERFMLVTAPSRFGKSINLDMLRRFFSVNVDDRGRKLPKASTDNYKLFFMRDLKIRRRFIFEFQFGTHPVIFLSFANVTTTSYKLFLDTFSLAVSDAYEDHAYLPLVSPSNSTYFVHMCNLLKGADSAGIVEALKSLARELHQYHNQQCILMVDDNDSPLNAALNDNKLTVEDMQRISDDLTTFLETIVTNSSEHVKRGIIMARVRIPPTLSEKVSNLTVKNVFHDKLLWKLFGFTEEDVRYLKPGLPEPDFQELKLFYSGYEVIGGTPVLCPVSVLKCMESKKYDFYWKEYGNWRFVKTVLSSVTCGQGIQEYIYGNEHTVSVSTGLEIEDLTALKKIVMGIEITDKTPRELVNIAMKYLVEIGYFTILASSTASEWKVKVPNSEIKTGLLSTLCGSYMTKKFPFVTSKLKKKFVDSFLHLKKSSDSFKELLDTLILMINSTRSDPVNGSGIEVLFTSLFINSGKFRTLFAPKFISTDKDHFKTDLVLTVGNNTVFVIDYEYEPETAHYTLNQTQERKYFLPFLEYETRITIGLSYQRQSLQLRALYNDSDSWNWIDLTRPTKYANHKI